MEQFCGAQLNNYSWYASVGQQEIGPVSSEELQQYVADGILKPDDYVWREGLTDWVPAHKVNGLFPNAPPRNSRPPAPRSTPKPSAAPQVILEKFCVACGQGLHKQAEICPHCGVKQPGVGSTGEKRILPALLLWFFLGFLGAHAFYCGRPGRGLLILFLVLSFVLIPVWFIVWLIEFFTLVTGNYTDGNGNKITEW